MTDCSESTEIKCPVPEYILQPKIPLIRSANEMSIRQSLQESPPVPPHTWLLRSEAHICCRPVMESPRTAGPKEDGLWRLVCC